MRKKIDIRVEEVRKEVGVQKRMITDFVDISQKTKYRFLIGVAVFFGVIAFYFNNPIEIIQGQITILTSPANLTTDYFALSNIGATFFNSGMLMLHAIAMVKVTRAEISGPVIAAVFTVAGFSFFGKNLYNSMPIVLGAFSYAKVTKVPSERSLLAALFGTALGPLVSEITFNLGLPLPTGMLFGCGAGFIAGFTLPPLANHFVKFTKGFSLYNVGFTSGVVGTIATSILRAMGYEIEPVSFYSGGHNTEFTILFICMFLGIILFGLYLNSWKLDGYFTLLRHTGQLSTDFLKEDGFSVTIMNMGLLGLISTSYVLFLEGEINGPVIGAILTVVGFGAFGKHLRNVLPILIGVMLMGYINEFNMSVTATIIAGLFGTTIAPIAGRYGSLVGIFAGALHLAVVGNTSYLHGGINLYNNGFSGGFIAAILIPLLETVQYHHRQRRAMREAVDPAEVISVEDSSETSPE